MEERGIDRRVRKTKRQLRQALMDLMSEKPSKSISVRELAERADINRGTFYIHYKDVSDLLQRLEDEMAERLILVCKKYAYSTSEVDAFPYLTELYRFAQDNADLCLVLLGPGRIPSVSAASYAVISCVTSWPGSIPGAATVWTISVPSLSPAT